MGHVLDEFQRHMAGCRERYAGRPLHELLHLFLLALEREEIVSVAYREGLIVRRLAAMPLDPKTREVIRHALIWAWKDEEMHAVYVRGAIVRMGSRLLSARAFLRQLAGAAGGWSSSIQQHARWRDAFLARAVASLITAGGALAGKAPREVRRHLRYGPFRDFCLFNVDAERTAETCWRRIEELAGSVDGLASSAGDFARIVADEVRHRGVFEVLAAALDDRDRLVHGESPEGLAVKIGAIGDHFLPRRLRTGTSLMSPIGSGAPVWVLEAAGPSEKLDLFRRTLDVSGLSRLLAARALALGKALPDLRVAIKATFMLGYNRRDPSPASDPALLEDLARYLREQGVGDVAVVEGPNIYDRFYRNRSVLEVAAYLGFASSAYRLVDISREQVPHEFGRGLAQYNVGRTWRDADFRIAFGKLRSHPVDQAYLTLANLEGLGARCEDFLFAERQAHRGTALMMLLDDFPPHHALLDAFEDLPDGLVGVMGCPRPKRVGRFYASADALALDLTAARHLGPGDVPSSPILRAALWWFGEPDRPIEVRGVDTPIRGWRDPYHGNISSFLAFLSYPVYAYGSLRGGLFVPEMDEEAFPPHRPPGLGVRFSRRVVRRLLGLGLPRGIGGR